MTQRLSQRTRNRLLRLAERMQRTKPEKPELTIWLNAHSLDPFRRANAIKTIRQWTEHNA